MAYPIDTIEIAIAEVEKSQSAKISVVEKRVDNPLRLGIFSSSFNPVTNAHVELIKTAAASFKLDEVLALAGTSNADKTQYETSLIDRLRMLLLAVELQSNVSVGLSSTGFFIDMLPALDELYSAETEFYFILGFDTYIRVIDRESKYVNRYQTAVKTRADAISQLVSRSRLIVAERGSLGAQHFSKTLESDPVLQSFGPFESDDARIVFMNFPGDFSERSSTEVRERLTAGKSIDGLVPHLVARFISEHRLYTANSIGDNV